MIGYGSFPGGDPRKFSPDPECSTEAEREAHRVACLRWNSGYRDEYPTHYFAREGSAVFHIARSAFGLGVYDDGTPECDRCHDSGMVNTGRPSDSSPDETVWEPCPECEGAGSSLGAGGRETP